MPTRMIIGALCAQHEADRRAQCRDTWMKTAAARGVRSLFLIGDHYRTVPALSGDELWLPVRDEYRYLPQKTRAFCQWALTEPDWEYLMKCDTDTYVAINRLLAYDAAGADYIGATWRDDRIYGSGGAGYLLSRRAAQIVTEHLTHKHGSEDLLVGGVLKKHKVPLTRDQEAFIPFGNWDRRPRPDNRIITTHGVGRDIFEACYREVG